MTTTTITPEPGTFSETEIFVLSCCTQRGGWRKADFSDPYKKQAFDALRARGLLRPAQFGHGYYVTQDEVTGAARAADAVSDGLYALGTAIDISKAGLTLAQLKALFAHAEKSGLAR